MEATASEQAGVTMSSYYQPDSSELHKYIHTSKGRAGFHRAKLIIPVLSCQFAGA